MNDVTVIYIALGLFGLVLGSFAGATVWRLRARQLVQDKAVGEDYDKDEFKRIAKLTKSSISHDRSQCLHCSYTLEWYDLIPLVSWITLAGKCRQCRKPIGYMEPLIELGMAIFFIVSYALWPYPLLSQFDIARLVIWLVAGVVLAILFVYDLKWFLLPDRVTIILIVLGCINVIVLILNTHLTGEVLLRSFGAVLILSGLYLVLYLISRGKWIGLGDVKLGLGLALFLADPLLAFIALFAANLIGCLVVIPGLISGKLSRQAHIPFGPLLILGLIVAQLFGNQLIALDTIGLF